MKYNVKQSTQRSHSRAGYLASAGLAGIVALTASACGSDPEVRNDFGRYFATQQVAKASKGASTNAEAYVLADLLKDGITTPTNSAKVKRANNLADTLYTEAENLDSEQDKRGKLEVAGALVKYAVGLLGSNDVLAADRVTVYDTASNIGLENMKLPNSSITLDNLIDNYSLAFVAADGDESAKTLLSENLKNFGSALETYLSVSDATKKDLRKTAFEDAFRNSLNAVASITETDEKAKKLQELSFVFQFLENSSTASTYADAVSKSP